MHRRDKTDGQTLRNYKTLQKRSVHNSSVNLLKFLIETESYSSLQIRALHHFTIRWSLGSCVNLKIKPLDLVEVAFSLSLLKILSHTALVG